MEKFLKILKSFCYFYFTCWTRKRGTNNKIILKGAFPKRVLFYISGNNNIIEIAENTKLYGTKIMIHGNNHRLIINPNCVIKKGMFHFKDLNCTINIGENTTTEGTNIIINEPNSNITIGKDCMFSHDTHIRNGDAHSIVDLQSKQRINFAKDITIGNHVWISAFAKILKGTIIQDNSIIAMGAIVSRMVESNTIVAGIPAKQIKKGVTWTRKRHYSTTQVPEELFWQQDDSDKQNEQNKF
jgi:acetyltransferase-like isoleucine patch superfamily enzyme